MVTSLVNFHADLNRTFPDNVRFRKTAEPCLQKTLYNVLLAYGMHNRGVGYCQVSPCPHQHEVAGAWASACCQSQHGQGSLPRLQPGHLPGSQELTHARYPEGQPGAVLGCHRVGSSCS